MSRPSFDRASAYTPSRAVSRQASSKQRIVSRPATGTIPGKGATGNLPGMR